MTGDQSYDVFISYAHADDEIPHGTSAEMGWVGTLAANLNIGPNVLRKEIFIDYQLKPGDEFSDELIAKVEKSKLLVIFLSKNYAKSDWCGKELAHFIKKHSDNSEKPNNVFVVELFPYERLIKLPDNIKNIRKHLIHAQFWYHPFKASTPLLAGYPTPDHHDNKVKDHYWNSLAALQAAIDERLDNYSEPFFTGKTSNESIQQDATSISSKESTEKPYATILLADVTEDLVAKRNEVKRALESEKIVVLPDGDYQSLTSDEFDKSFAEDLNCSELFVQLLSPTPGRQRKGFAAPLPQLQFQRARDANRPIIQWCEKLPEFDQNYDQKHRRLFETEFLRVVDIINFKAEIIERLHAEKTERKKELEAIRLQSQLQVGQKYIFLDDLASTTELREKVRITIKNQNFEIRSIPAGISLETAKESLRPCLAGITIFTDKTQKETIYYRLLFFLNQIAAANLPFLRWGVYLHEGDVNSVFGIDSKNVVPVNENSLMPFLQGLSQ